MIGTSNYKERELSVDFSENNLKRLAEAWAPLIKGLSEWCEHVASVMRKWFPAISQTHRAEVKRVHTAYDKKRRARRRRK